MGAQSSEKFVLHLHVDLVPKASNLVYLTLSEDGTEDEDFDEDAGCDNGFHRMTFLDFPNHKKESSITRGT